MKTIRMSVVLAGLLGAATLSMVPAAMSGSASTGWDVFRAGAGESLIVTSAMGSEAGQGLDPFYSGDGVRIDDFAQAYMGTSQSDASGGGWDVFRSRSTEASDPLP